jgi:hypothetical protein
MPSNPRPKAKRPTIAQEYADAKRKGGLSLRQALLFTPPYNFNKAKDVVVKAYNPKGRTKSGYPAIIGTLLTVDGEHHTPKQVTIIGFEKGVKIKDQAKVLVSCNCGNWTFVWEYAMSTWGAANIIHSNGQPASWTNSSNHPGVCKHLVALAKLVIKQGD